MANSSFIQLPQDVSDSHQLRRFLDKLILQLDIAFGNRGGDKFTTSTEVGSEINSIQETLDFIKSEEAKYTLVDGTKPFTGVINYDTDKTFTDDKSLIAKKYADDNFSSITHNHDGVYTNNPQQTAIGDLGQTISDPPTQAEVQAISDKVDAILVALRGANII